MKKVWITLLIPIVALAIAIGSHSFGTPEQVGEDIQRTALQYFLDHAHPATGLVRDKANNFAVEGPDNRVASIAATGFGLAVISHASYQGLVTKDFAQQYCTKTVRFMRDQVPRKFGWFLHWVDWETGARVWDSEYSTVDSALFLGGALYAAQLFPNSECSSLVDQVYRETDFIAAMTDAGAAPTKRVLSMGYIEGRGWITSQWDMYAEQRLLLILGLGHAVNPIPPEAWLAFRRDTHRLPTGEEVMGLGEALFTHQYSELFLDFRAFGDPLADYWRNGELISRYQRSLARGNTLYKTLSEGFWGFSAGESPTGYDVFSALKYRGTVCMGCTIASAMFMPQLVLADASAWLKSPYRNQIWGRYGFSDSLDIDQNWFDSRVLGITVGPEYMSVANIAPDTSFWKDFMQIPAIKAGMDKAKAAGLYKVAKIM